MKVTLDILFLFIILSIFSCQDTKQLKKEKPNILLIIADDMGYGDLECYGGKSNTPNINQLAKNGILFTDFYAAAPNCSPSRAGLLTGRNPAKIGIYNYRPPNHPMHLRANEITIAEVLKKQGYQTSHIGKWHLGCLPQDTSLNHPQPKDQGFDYSFGTESNSKPSHLNPINFVRNGEKLNTQKGYSCQILANEAVNWLDNHSNKQDPFFMYLAFHEPHSKIASPPELVEKYKEYPKKEAEYLANIENLDLATGKIIDYLNKNNLLENTLILFSSDNGSYRQASNGDLRAVKSYVYEGGIRVPGIIHWPKLKGKKRIINEAAGFVDIMPTICDILKINSDKQQYFDGTSIANLLIGEEFERKNHLFWYFYRTSPEIAMRIDDYMILGKDWDTIPRTHRFSSPDMEYVKEMNLTKFELFDLKKDWSQDHNIIDQHPKSKKYKELLNQKLKEIQTKGYEWKNLPKATGKKKLKSKWVIY